MKHLIRRVALAAALALSLPASHAGSACWVWSAQEAVPGMAEKPNYASVALDGTGAAWVLATERMADGDRVRMRQQSGGGLWQAPVDLFELNGASSDRVTVQADREGNGIAVWNHRTEEPWESHIYAASYSPSRGWDEARRLEADSSFFSVAMAPNGYSMVITDSSDYWEHAGYVHSWSPASGWSAVEALGPWYRYRFGTYRLAVNSAGQSVVSWLWAGNVLAMHRHRPNGRWSHPAYLNGTGRQFDGRFMVMAPVRLNEQGEAMVAWSDRERPQHARVFTRRMQMGQGGWQPAEMLSGEQKLKAVHPLIDLNDAGQAMVSWRRLGVAIEYPPYQIQTRRDLGAGWEPTRRMESGHSALDETVIAMSPQGHTVTAWKYAPKKELASPVTIASTVQLPHGQRITTTHVSRKGAVRDSRLWLAKNAQGQMLLAWDDFAEDGSYRLMTQRGEAQQGPGCGTEAAAPR